MAQSASITNRSALQSAAILSLSSVGLQVLGFAYRIFIIRVTGPGGMGVYQLVMPVYFVVMSVAISGLCTAVTNLTSGLKALGDRVGMKRLMGLSLGLFLIFFALAAIPAALFSGWISQHALGDSETQLALMIMLPCLFLTGFENIFKSWFYGVKNVKPPALSDNLEQVVRIAAVVALLLVFQPKEPAMAAALIMAGMTVSEMFSSTYLAIRYARAQPALAAEPAPKRPDSPLLGKILSVALPVSAASLAGNLLASANTVLIPQRLIVSGMPQSQAVGALGILMGMAMPLFMLPMAFMGPLATVLLPRLSEGCAVGNNVEVHGNIGRALHATGLIALPAVAVMAVIGRPACSLLFGQDLPQKYFNLIAASAVFIYYQMITSGILNGIGKQKAAMANTIAGGIVQLAFTWFAVADPRLGIYGFLWGMAVSSAVTALLNMNVLMGRAGLKISWSRWFALPALAAAACGLAAENVWLLTGTLGFADTPRMLWAFFTGIVAFALCSRLQGVRLGKYLKLMLPQRKMPTQAMAFQAGWFFFF